MEGRKFEKGFGDYLRSRYALVRNRQFENGAYVYVAGYRSRPHGSREPQLH